MSSRSPEHRAVGFECHGCGEGFETALGLSRHRARCEETEIDTEVATDGGDLDG